MDKRYKPSTPELDQQRLAIALDEALTRPDWEPAQCLRHLKQSVRLTTRELAQKAGVSARTVQDIEQGHSPGTVRTMNQLLAVFGLQLGIRRLRQVEADKPDTTP